MSLGKAVLLEGESAASVLLGAMRSGSSLSSYTKYGDVTASAVSAAAAAALKSTPAYAVLGTTMGSLSFDKISSLLK